MTDWHISTRTPGCVVFLVEQSGEIAKRGVSGFSLSFEMKRIVDMTISDLLESNRKAGKVVPRVKVGIFGYSNCHFSWCSTLRQEASGLKMISDEFCQVEKEYIDEKNHLVIPDFFIEHLRGDGDIASGISNLTEVVQRFAFKHPESPPPIVYHVFHSEPQHAQKKNILYAMQNLKSVATKNGNTLLFNIKINSHDKNFEIFPHEYSVLNDHSNVVLMEGSSYLPLSLQEMFNWHNLSGAGNYYKYNVERKCFILTSGEEYFSKVLITPFRPLSSAIHQQKSYDETKGFALDLG